MSHPAPVLRQPESYPESRLPPHVQALQRPPALGRAVEAGLPALGEAPAGPTEQFWRDFGMHVVSKPPGRLVARAAGPAPCIAMAVQGPCDRFVGPAFRMSDDTDLDRYIKEARGARARARVDTRCRTRHRAVRPLRAQRVAAAGAKPGGAAARA